VPLIQGKSKKSFEKNLKTEMEHGKPQKQSLAIAYAMKRKAKKMAEGGQAGPVLPGADDAQESMRKAFHFAEGGPVAEKKSGYLSMPEEDVKSNSMAMSEDKMGFNQHPVEVHDSLKDDFVNRIMKKLSPDYSGEARLSQGGQVANDVGTEKLAGFDPNEFDDLVLRDDLESSYGEDDNSGDALGNEREDMDRKDIVSRIMKSRRKKDRMPSPA
jgi:hypothetical protein